jgi:hypothetical protein
MSAYCGRTRDHQPGRDGALTKRRSAPRASNMAAVSWREPARPNWSKAGRSPSPAATGSYAVGCHWILH